MLIKKFKVHNDRHYMGLLLALRNGSEVTMSVQQANQMFTGYLAASHPEQMAFSLVVTERVTLKDN